MQSNSNRSASTSLISTAISIVVSLLISACSGGISGTGDGGPPIIVNTDMNTSAVDSTDADVADGSADSDAADSDNTNGATQDSSAPQNPADSNSATLTPDTSQLVPDALLLLNSRNENVSAVQPLAAQLSALQQQASLAIQVPASVTGTLIDNISDAFDTTLRFSLENSETLIASSSTSTDRYLFSTNNEQTLYVLQESSTLTVRHLIRATNSLLQARVILLPDGSTIIEADLNQNGTQGYFQTYTNTTITAAFARHPTDPSVARQRELIDETGSVLTVQNCTDVSQDCDLDNNWTNATATNNTQFANARSAIENSLGNIASPVFTLPDTVNEAVLTQVTFEQMPDEEQIQCGVQRVRDSVRTFCLLPQPLGPTSLFSESLAGSEIFYLLLE